MAGGSKSDLLLGAAMTGQIRSVIFRRQYRDLGALVDRAVEIVGHQHNLNHSSFKWRRPDLRFPIGWTLEFGAAQAPGSEQSWQGRAHDLKAFDEVAQFPESVFLYLCGWLRSVDINVRKRIVAAGNPPITSEGAWLFERYAAWLDPDHTDPAVDGELRWYVRAASGKEIQVDGPKEEFIEDEWLIPQSRTFIRSTLDDNVYIDNEYRRQLQALPEPMRSVFLKGDFTAWQQDDLWQVIPTAWVLEAQKRWTEDGRPDAKMVTIGVDPARGGEDETVISARTQNWFHPQVCVPGLQTPDGPSIATLIQQQIPEDEDPMIIIDAIGIGSAVVDATTDDHRVYALNSSSRDPSAREKTGRYSFANKRAQYYWRLREALDPDHGENLALPPDRKLRADLTAPRYKVRSSGIQIEAKDEIHKRLGRSTDRGDAAVYAFAHSGLEGISSESFAIVGEITKPDWADMR